MVIRKYPCYTCDPVNDQEIMTEELLSCHLSRQHFFFLLLYVVCIAINN